MNGSHFGKLPPDHFWLGLSPIRRIINPPKPLSCETNASVALSMARGVFSGLGYTVTCV